MKIRIADSAALRSGGPCAPKQWGYVLDGLPECNGIAAMHHLKSAGFSTEEAGAYLRELQGPTQPIQMDPAEEHLFEP